MCLPLFLLHYIELEHNALNEGGTQMNKTKYDKMAEELASYCAEKDHKYNHAFAKMMNEYGIDYALSKLEEKLYRMKQLKNLEILDHSESFQESCKDLWCYSLLTILYLAEEEEKKDKETRRNLHSYLRGICGGEE